jgi:hypothetical protein
MGEMTINKSYVAGLCIAVVVLLILTLSNCSKNQDVNQDLDKDLISNFLKFKEIIKTGKFRGTTLFGPNGEVRVFDYKLKEITNICGETRLGDKTPPESCIQDKYLPAGENTTITIAPYKFKRFPHKTVVFIGKGDPKWYPPSDPDGG